NGFQLGATWSGTLGGFLDITNSYYFNKGDEIVHVVTTVTALTDLTNLAFVRSVDPDPDVNRFDNFNTVNTRGDSTHSAADLVSSAGAVSGLTLGILNESGNTFTHNSAVWTSCCATLDPTSTLTGGPSFPGLTFPATETGDYGLNMAWLIG